MSDAAHTGISTVSAALALQVEKICRQFEAAWKTGQRPPLEDFLGGVNEADRVFAVRELVLMEIACRKRQGETPQAEEYLSRFPTLDLPWLRKEIANTPGPALPPPDRVNRTPTAASDESDGGPANKIRCPTCNNPIQLGEKLSDQVLCPGCGSVFRLRDAKFTDTASGMKRMGKFQLLERLGLGGFGAVWKARDTELDRIVALKIPHTGLLTEAEELVRFQREARAAAQLRHPNIVSVHEVATLNDLPVIVAEFVPGVPLKDLLEVRSLTFRQTAALVAQVADALDYAHSLGVVHRDIKPANVMLMRGTTTPNPAADGAAKFTNELADIGKPMILDFGLALRAAIETTMTMDGFVLGTPAYMSPEQAAGQSHQADRRSDVYSLGVVLYQLLTGELPFRGSRVMMLDQVLREEPRHPRKINDKIPRDLETICLKCLRKEPPKRYGTAAELADDLRRHLRGEPILARPIGRVERTVKWVKRNRIVSALMAGILIVLVALSIATVLLTSANKNEREARGLAEQQTRRAKEALADTQTFSGLVAGDNGDPAQAALWFATAAGMAPHDEHRALANRLRFQLWSRELPRITRSFEQICMDPPVNFDWDGTPFLSHIAQLSPHPDGTHVLARSASSGRWALWNAQAQKRERMPQEADGISAACWSAQGDFLAVGTAKGRCLVRRMPEMDAGFEVPVGGPVSDLAFSRDGCWLAVAHNKEVRIWDCKRAMLFGAPFQLPDNVEWLVFDGKGTRLAVATAKDRKSIGAVSILLMDDLTLREGQRALRRLAGPLVNWPNFYGTFSHLPPVWVDDNKGVLTCAAFNQIGWWNAETGKLLRQFKTDNRSTFAIVASPDGEYVAVADWTACQIYNARSGERIGLPMRHKDAVRCAAFSRDGRQLLTGSTDQTVRIWSVPGGIPQGPALQMSNEVWATAFLGTGLLTGQIDGLIQWWQKVQPVLPFRDFALPRGSYVDFASFLDQQGRYLLSPTPSEGVQVIDLKLGKRVGQSLEKVGRLFLGAFIPRGSRAIIQSENIIQCWDWQAGGRIWGPVNLPSTAYSLAVRPDGSRVVAMCADRGVMLDTNTGQPLAEFVYKAKPEMLNSKPFVRFSPDGSCFASFFAWTTVEVRDTATAKPRFATLKMDARVDGIAFSPNSRYLAAGSTDNTARVFDLATGQELAKLAHPFWVREVAFSKDGRRLLTTCRDGSARLWDWRTGKLDSPRMIQNENSWMNAELFVPDTSWVVTATDSAMQVWDSVLGKSVTPALLQPKCRFLRMALDDRYLTAFTDGGVVRVYDLAPLTVDKAPRASAPELRLLAELQSMHEISEDGGLVRLTTKDWLERWHTLKREYPKAIRDDPRPESDSADETVRIFAAIDRGNSALAAKDYDKAIAEFTKAIRLYPEYVNGFINRARAWSSKKDDDKAIADYAEAIHLDPESVSAYLNRAQFWFDKQNYDKAIADYGEVIRLDAKNAAAFNSRGAAWINKKDYDKAIGDYSEVIRLDPKDMAAHCNRGYAWSIKKNYDMAIADYNETIRLNPNYARSYFNRGTVWSDKKDYDKAIADFNEAIRLDPKLAMAYSNRGYAWSNKKNYDKAIADYNEAIRLDPNDAMPYNNRGYAWNNKNDYDKAIADFNEAIRLDPKLAMAYSNRGNAWSAKKDYDKAIADYSEAIRLDPKDAFAFRRRGDALSEKKQYDKAIADFNEAIHLAPDYAIAWNNKAWLLATCPDAKFHDGAKAVEAGKNAVKLDPKDSGAIDTLAAAYARAGKFEEAIRWQERSLEDAQLPRELQEEFRERLKLYRSGKAYQQE